MKSGMPGDRDGLRAYADGVSDAPTPMPSLPWMPRARIGTQRVALNAMTPMMILRASRIKGAIEPMGKIKPLRSKLSGSRHLRGNSEFTDVTSHNVYYVKLESGPSQANDVSDQP